MSASCSRTSRRCPRSSATRCCGVSSTARATRRSRASWDSPRARPRASSSAPARTSLREREARSEDCAEVRMQLIEAADAHRRAKPQTLRHVAKCPACREFRRELKASDRAIAILDPGILLIGLGAGGGLKWLVGKGAAAKTTAAVTRRRGRGRASSCSGRRSSAPAIRRRSRSRAPPSRPVSSRRSSRSRRARRSCARRCGSPPAAASASRPCITCPAGLRVADLLPPTGAKLRVAYAPLDRRRREPRRARQPHRPGARAADTRVTVSVLCRRADRRPARSAPPTSARPRTPTHRVSVARAAAARQPRRRGERLGPPRSAGRGRAHVGRRGRAS